MERETARKLAAEIRTALEPIAAAYNLTLEAGRSTYGATGFRMALNLAAVAEDGTNLRALEGMPHDKRDYLGKLVLFQGEAWRVTGFNYKAPRYPVNVTRLKGGKGYRLPASVLDRPFLAEGGAA